MIIKYITVEPRSTDTRLIRTPWYYGQFCWSRRKPHTFSLKLTRLIRTPINTDNGHFSVSRVTNSYTLSTPLYGHYLSAHCEFSLSQLFANLKTLGPGQIMAEFEELKPFYYKEKLNSVASGVWPFHFLCLLLQLSLVLQAKSFRAKWSYRLFQMGWSSLRTVASFSYKGNL